MPVLFGNTYMLPAIIVVVLLLILLLIIMMRKRSGSSTPKTVGEQPKKPAKATKAAKTKPSAAPTRVVPPVADRVVHELAFESTEATSATAPSPAAAVAVSEELAPVSAQEPVVEPAIQMPVAPRPSVAPEGRHTGAETSLKSDPLQAIVVDILQGWGDVSDEDIKRLAVFRPDKVAAALQAMELPKELKSSQSARNRLMQLRRSAMELVEQERQRAAAAATAPSPTPTAVDPANPVGSAPFFSLKPQPAPSVPDEIPEAAQPAAEQAEMPQPAAGDPEWLTAWQTPETAESEVVTAPAEVPTVEVAPAEMVPMDLPPLQTAPVDAPVEIRAADMPPFEIEHVEVPPVAAEIPPVEPQSPPARWLEEDVETESPWQGNEPSLFETPVQSHSSLPKSIKTAEELLSLPAAEQADMVTFLEPAELSKVFERAEDSVLKKAIIDTLEHVSNPASLDVLRRCLDDPDPQIQLYALEAADRLLGVD
jgi:hypothetical protein